MNKSLLLIASLALGTGAIAQDQPPAGGSMSPGMSTGTDATSPGQASQPQTPDQSAPSTSDPSTAAPTAGTPDAGSAPTGGGMSSTPDTSGGAGMSGMSGGSGAMGGTQTADTSNYPKCSRTVTDKCVQAGGMMAHHATHRRPH